MVLRAAHLKKSEEENPKKSDEELFLGNPGNPGNPGGEGEVGLAAQDHQSKLDTPSRGDGTD